jgi:biopolymer transport protein ExbB/TolQ
MLVANLATLALNHVPAVATWMFQEETVQWDPLALWHHMGIVARLVVIILFIMSGWSIGVMIDRWMAFNAARKQSRAFAPAVAGALRDGKIDEAIKVAERNKKSHLAKVVTAGLMEFRAHQESGEIPGETIEASKRALERTEAIVHAELKRGLGGLATIGSTAPFVGLFGTVMGILNAFQETGRGCRRYFGSTGDHRHRTGSRDSGRHDVQLPDRPRGSVRRGDGQLLERTDRLLPEAPRGSAPLGVNE